MLSQRREQYGTVPELYFGNFRNDTFLDTNRSRRESDTRKGTHVPGTKNETL